MFIHNINPNLINIGPFSIRFYGIVYALGFLLVHHILVKASKDKKIKNLDQEKASDIVIWTMIFGLIGARIMQILAELPYYLSNPFEIIAIWHGGLYFQGGLIAGILFIYLYCKKHKISMIEITDIVSVPLPLIIGFGRIANYINSEHIGFPTQVPWCVVFQRIDDICRHPAQLYQALTQFLLFGILYILSMKTKKKGLLTWSFITGYGFLRFFTDFYRTDMPRILFGMTITQLINLAMFGLGLYFLVEIKKRNLKKHSKDKNKY